MKITRIRTFRCSDGDRSFVFVQVHTDEGLVGSGQPYQSGTGAEIVAALESLEPWVVGQDPAHIEGLMARARDTWRGRFQAGAALSCIEHALWDIAGKAADLPLYMLLGGRFRDRVRVYHALKDAPAEETAEHALALMDDGYSAFSVTPLPESWPSMPWNAVVLESARRIEALRRALGDNADIAVDLGARLSEPVRAGQLIHALAPFQPMFIGEPLGPGHIPSLRRLREQADAPLATGRSLNGVGQYADLIDAQATDVVQPDLTRCGGIMEAKKIAAVAEANYVTVAPYNPLGLLSTAVSLHFAASTPNFAIMEYPGDHARPGARFVDDPWKPVDGYLPLPTRTGLGMELDQDAIAKSPP